MQPVPDVDPVVTRVKRLLLRTIEHPCSGTLLIVLVLKNDGCARPGAADGDEDGLRERLAAIDSGFDIQYRLTPREREIALLLADRHDYGSIAQKLGITRNTLKTHIGRIYRKYDIRRRKDLLEMAGTGISR